MPSAGHLSRQRSRSGYEAPSPGGTSFPDSPVVLEAVAATSAATAANRDCRIGRPRRRRRRPTGRAVERPSKNAGRPISSPPPPPCWTSRASRSAEPGRGRHRDRYARRRLRWPVCGAAELSVLAAAARARWTSRRTLAAARRRAIEDVGLVPSAFTIQLRRAAARRRAGGRAARRRRRPSRRPPPPATPPGVRRSPPCELRRPPRRRTRRRVVDRSTPAGDPSP